MAAKSEEALEKRRKYHREWHRANKATPEQNRERYAVFRKKLEDPEFRDAYNAKQRERRRVRAEAKRAAETDADRAAKKQRWLEAIIASNKARAKPKEPKQQIPKMVKPKRSFAEAVAETKRKPGRIVALSGWKGW